MHFGTDFLRNCIAILVGVLVLAGMILFIGSIAFLGSRAAKAQEQDTRWAQRRFCAHYGWDGSCVRYRYERRRVHHYREPAPIRYYAAPRYDEERDDRGRCHDVRKAVGDQHLTVDGAKKAANDAWAGTVRFHLGESAMDLSNAREITYVCSRSSIKEAGSSITTLGQALTRCEISAQPCRPPKLPLEREER